MKQTRSCKSILISIFSIDHDRLAYKLFFALVYGGITLVMNFSALYFKQLGLASHEIGLVSAVRQICSLLVVPSLCPFVEIKRYRKLTITVAIAVLVCCITTVGFAFRLDYFRCDSMPLDLTLNITDYTSEYTCCHGQNDYESEGVKSGHWSSSRDELFLVAKSRITSVFIIICILYGLGDVAWMAIRIISEVSLTESLGSNSERFGTSKVYGAVGGAFFSVIVSYFIDQTTVTVRACSIDVQRTDYAYCFIANAVLFSLAAIVVFFLQLNVENKAESCDKNCGVDRWMVTRPELVKLYILTFFYGLFKASTLTAFAYVYLSDMGGSNLLIGTASSLFTLSSIVAGFFSSFFICQFGFKILFPSLAATTFSLVMFSFLKTNWFIIIANLCQGVTPVLEWNVHVYTMRQIAADDQTGTAYSIMTFTSKIGKLITSVLSGYVYGIAGPVVLFRSYAVLSVAVGFIIFQTFGSLGNSHGAVTSTEALECARDERKCLLDNRNCMTLPPFTVDCKVEGIQPS